MNLIIEQFIKESNAEKVMMVDMPKWIRFFADYLTANGYEIVKKEECERNGECSALSLTSQMCLPCRERHKKEYFTPETPTLPEKIVMRGHVDVIKTINEIIDYLAKK